MLKTGDDTVDRLPDIRSHSSDTIESESRSEESAHGLVILFAFDPHDATAGESFDNGAEDGRVRIVVGILREHTVDGFGVGNAKLEKKR
jgi:hypothetical protein